MENNIRCKKLTDNKRTQQVLHFNYFGFNLSYCLEET
jgi:hypothetical protein